MIVAGTGVSTTPAPEADQMPTRSDLCQHCHHAWHGMRCHCGCLTSFVDRQPDR